MPCPYTNMKFKTIASGSKGNCSILICKESKFIIDIGVSYLVLKRSLALEGLAFTDFIGVLITHSHSDHIKGLSALIKHTKLKIMIPEEMYHELKDIVPIDRVMFLNDYNIINDTTIELIHTSHDTDCSVGFIFENNSKSLVYITDTGYINRKFLKKMINKNIYLFESNHDEKMLMDGPYPQFLKQRVISDRGHLSNKTSSKYLESITGENTKYIILAHLSEKNNTENLALEEINRRKINSNINVLIARQNEESPLIEV